MSESICPKCGQSVYHSGEYPCSMCGRPLVWDGNECYEPKKQENLDEYEPELEAEKEIIEQEESKLYKFFSKLKRLKA